MQLHFYAGSKQTSNLFLKKYKIKITSDYQVRYRITESQNIRDWKGPQMIIWSNPPARPGTPRLGHTRMCSGGF